MSDEGEEDVAALQLDRETRNQSISEAKLLERTKTFYYIMSGESLYRAFQLVPMLAGVLLSHGDSWNRRECEEYVGKSGENGHDPVDL